MRSLKLLIVFAKYRKIKQVILPVIFIPKALVAYQ